MLEGERGLFIPCHSEEEREGESGRERNGGGKERGLEKRGGENMKVSKFVVCLLI